MGLPVDLRQVTVTAAGESLQLAVMNFGNPQCVSLGPLPDEDRFRRLGPALERHPIFPERSNVEFAHVEAPDTVRILIWERGVGPTMSSGTGSCAALIAAAVGIVQQARQLLGDNVGIVGNNDFLIGDTLSEEAGITFSEMPRFAPENFAYLHNDTPAHFKPSLTREIARTRLNLPLNAQIATYTGHMAANKGVDILVRVALELPNVTFLLIGPLPGSKEERRVVELARRLGAHHAAQDLHAATAGRFAVNRPRAFSSEQGQNVRELRQQRP